MFGPFFWVGWGMKPLDSSSKETKNRSEKPGRFVRDFGRSTQIKKTPEFQDVFCKKNPEILDGPLSSFITIGVN